MCFDLVTILSADGSCGFLEFMVRDSPWARARRVHGSVGCARVANVQLVCFQYESHLPPERTRGHLEKHVCVCTQGGQNKDKRGIRKHLGKGDR